ncbi:MAG: J domain-containing protein [Acidobacteriota bacterium]|nr:J domain-containing protein [Acidobacteriota bacterium]
MSGAAIDPYAVLGVAPDVSDDELRRVYRTLVMRHHPDHNGGSAQSAARFAQIQSAYAAITERRIGAEPTPGASASAGSRIDERIAALERELAAKRAAAAQAEAEAHAEAQGDRRRPTPEELGQYTTDDSFTKIVDDAAAQLGERLRGSEAGKQFARRLSDLFGRDD